jgi:DUF1680 family protein
MTVACVALVTVCFHPDVAAQPGALRVEPFSLSQVHLLDGPFLSARQRVRDYLISLDTDRLLHNLRVTAGLPSSVKPYGGWEDPGSSLRGNFMGHYLSACARMFASTGDQELLAKVNTVIAELGRCQAQSQRGYLAGFPETFFDTLEGGKLGIPGGSVPYYSMHKLLSGLRDTHVHCDNQQALDIMVKLASWIHLRTERLSKETMAKILMVEFGGMNEALLNLYALTKNPEHLQIARRFSHEWLYEPLARGQDNLTALHGNTTAPKIVGAARHYEITGEQRYRDISEFFWQQIAQHRTFVTGGSTRDETWQEFPDRLSSELSGDNQEFCVTYNLMKLSRHLFSWNPNPKYAHYTENALANHALAVIDPRSAMMDPKLGLRTGEHKHYTEPHSDFGCCLGTSCETFAGAQENIYFRRGDELYVNLVLPSTLNWPEKGLTFTQVSSAPGALLVRYVLELRAPTRLTLKILIPPWVEPAARIQGANTGIRQTDLRAGHYATLDRTWPEGKTTLVVELPARLRAVPMPDDETVMAFAYGPVVLASRVPPPSKSTDATRFLKDPTLVASSDRLEDWIRPVPNRPLTFRITGQKSDYELVPLSKIVDAPYRVYWRVYQADRKPRRNYVEFEARWNERKERTIDVVKPGLEVLEVHRLGSSAHEMTMRNYIWGEREEQSFFFTRPGGGGFQVKMAIHEDQPMAVSCVFWGSDIGHLYDIVVEGTRIATQEVDRNQRHSFIDVEYKIPPELTAGKTKVTVELRDRADSLHAPVFECRIVRGKD